MRELLLDVTGVGVREQRIEIQRIRGDVEAHGRSAAGARRSRTRAQCGERKAR
jgi:hypothetical protein